MKLNNQNSLSTHRLVKAPKKLVSKNDFLLVGLQPYLGKINNAGDGFVDFKLESAGDYLILKDAKGIVHRSSKINIGWEKAFLPSPVKIARKVAGPFSSFESAEQLSFKLKSFGIQSLIANPRDWEVWVPHHFSIPKQFNFQLFTETIDYVIQPVLKLTRSELLLSGPVQIEANDGLRWEGSIYSGPFILKPDAYGSWTFIEKLLFPQYLKGVVPNEIGFGSPEQAMAAQAVLARTWALANSHRFAIDGYHLCSDTQCQVYKDPEKANEKVVNAIKSTSGKFLAWEGKPIHAVYHATNGGITASAREAWSISSLPYLLARLDGSSKWRDQFLLPLKDDAAVENFLAFSKGAFGNDHYLFRWKKILTAKEIQTALQPFYSNFELPKMLKVKERGPSGRALTLQIVGSQDKSPIVLRLDNIRRILRKLPSTLFVVNQLREGVWEFSGGGFGHGSGLSQSGAIDLARRGWSSDKILMHYYPGTEYETLP